MPTGAAHRPLASWGTETPLLSPYRIPASAAQLLLPCSFPTNQPPIRKTPWSLEAISKTKREQPQWLLSFLQSLLALLLARRRNSPIHAQILRQMPVVVEPMRHQATGKTGPRLHSANALKSSLSRQRADRLMRKRKRLRHRCHNLVLIRQTSNGLHIHIRLQPAQ